MAEHEVVKYRDAESGEYVTEEYALAHPSTTVKETEIVTDPVRPEPTPLTEGTNGVEPGGPGPEYAPDNEDEVDE